jgi:hypothetical protein
MMPYCQRQALFMSSLPLPALHQLTISFVSMGLYALAAAGLIAALGIMIAIAVRRLDLQMILLWGVQIGFALVLMFSLLSVAWHNRQTFNLNQTADYSAFCDNGFAYPPPEECPAYYARRDQQRVIETLQVTATSFIDHGTLVQLNLLNNSYNLTTGNYLPSLGSLLRNGLSVSIALATYVILIPVVMGFGTRYYERQAKR